MLDQFLDDVIHKDFLFRFMFDEAELLVFSSTILHQNHQSKFCFLARASFN